jgi:hypothetical protein
MASSARVPGLPVRAVSYNKKRVAPEAAQKGRNRPEAGFIAYRGDGISRCCIVWPTVK